MSIIVLSESNHTVVIEVNSELITFFGNERIFFDKDRRNIRLRDGRDRVIFKKSSRVEPYVGIFRGNDICEIGSFSYSRSPLNRNIKIGRYCSIAGSFRVPEPRHPIEALTTSSMFYDKKNSIAESILNDFDDKDIAHIQNPQRPPVIIENDVWICENVMIMPGIKIGTGAVLMPGAVVTKDVPPYAKMGGNPAVVKGYRFSDDTIARLLKIEWWHYGPWDISRHPIDDPVAFLNSWEHQEVIPPIYSPTKKTLWERLADYGNLSPS